MDRLSVFCTMKSLAVRFKELVHTSSRQPGVFDYLVAACVSNDWSLFYQILQTNDQFNVNECKDNGQNILHHICTHFTLKEIPGKQKRLVTAMGHEQINTDKAEAINDSNDPIDERSKVQEIIVCLIKRGLDLNKTDDWGCTALVLALQMAVFRNMPLDLVRILLAKGSNPDICNIEGESILMKAANCSNWICGRRRGRQVSEEEIRIHRKHMQITALLVSSGACPNQRDNHQMTALMMVAVGKDVDDIGRILTSAPSIDVNITNSRKQTALHLAILKNNFSVAKLILNCSDCQVNVLDADGYTPLFLAVWDRRHQLDPGSMEGHRAPFVLFTEALLQKGADPNIPDNTQMYPIQRALDYYCDDLIKLLIQHGSSVDIAITINANSENKFTMSLMELLIAQNNYGLATMVYQAGAPLWKVSFENAGITTKLRLKFESNYEYFRSFTPLVLSLLASSRIVIRRKLGGQNLHNKIKIMPIPAICKSYLCMVS